MGVRDRLERVAAWFGFGVDDDDYYEEEEDRRYGKDPHGNGARDDEPGPAVRRLGRAERSSALDRKSTRLNSSHANISYAVFCLKKKKTNSKYELPALDV